MTPALVAEVTRNGFVEGTHTGSVVVLDAAGAPLLTVGDTTAAMLPRSCNKPLQAVGLLDAGWVPGSTEQLAVAASSHSGEPGHLAVVQEVLGDLPLGCPALPPVSQDAWLAMVRAGEAPSRLTMECSGKHAAMLRTCVVNGWPMEGYLDADHPVQQACRTAVERLSGERVEHVVVDGCGAPQHSLSLRGLATAFAAVAALPVADAMRAHPWLVGGTGREVTALMEGVPGLVCKEGAAHVWAAALPGVGSVAVRLDDVGGLARTPVLVAALRVLGVDAPVLDALAERPVLGGGVQVGEVRAAGALLG